MTGDRRPDREAAADAIDRFVAAVSSWIGWFKLIKFEEAHILEPNGANMPPGVKALLEPFVVKHSPELEEAMEAHDRHAAGQRIFEHTQKQGDAMVNVRDAGRSLAADLELLGIDSTPVLTIIHCTEQHGGGPGYVLPRWEELKVALRRTAIRLRLPPGSAAVVASGPAALEAPATPTPPSAPEVATSSPPPVPTNGHARRHGEVVTGTSAMLDVLKIAGLGVRKTALLDALDKKEIEGADLDTSRKDQPWRAPRESLLAWGRRRRGLTP